MKKYTVDLMDSCQIKIEASSPEAAEKMARSHAIKQLRPTDFVLEETGDIEEVASE